MEPVSLTICAFIIAFGGGYTVKKITDSYNKSQKNKQRKIEIKGKSIEQAREENKKSQAEIDDWKKKHEENENKIKDIEKKIEDAKSKSNDPNLGIEERSFWKNRVAQYEDEINTLRKNGKNIFDSIKGVSDRMKKNNEIISGTTSNLDDKHWVWDLVTLENIVVVGGCYAIYKILKDDKK